MYKFVRDVFINVPPTAQQRQRSTKTGKGKINNFSKARRNSINYKKRNGEITEFYTHL